MSDGASNILESISGICIKLQWLYPNIIVWYYCNHKLKLAISDTLKEFQGTNNFQYFIEKWCILHHQSHKNINKLNVCANSLEEKLMKIGKLFTIRWVVSSEKTLKAVWNNFSILHEHFLNASNVNRRESKDKSKYARLKKILTLVEFVHIFHFLIII